MLLLSEDFEISKSHIIISQSIKKFTTEISNHKTEIIKSVKIDEPKVEEKTFVIESKPIITENDENKKPIATISTNQTDLFTKFINLITSKKLKDDELILLHYIIETGRFKLMTGWQEQNEINNINEWEVINEIDSKLSRNYSSILKRFELRGFTEVSALTSSNNPKELKIREEISNQLLDLPEAVMNIIIENIDKNHFEYTAKIEAEETDDLPF